MFSRLRGAHVDIAVRRKEQADYVSSLGLTPVLGEPDDAYESVIEATGAVDVPERALARVAMGGRLALLGVPAGPVGLRVSTLVHQDITVTGVLGGSSEIAATIEVFAGGLIDLEPLVARRIGLDEVDAALAEGLRRQGTPQPKTQVVVSGAA
jgi:threonine dehydrogenase-like Zn-dependent dehydrogenase